MGEVIRATRLTDGSEVAIKRMLGPGTGVGARRFAREASLRVAHPNVVEVYEAGADAEGRLYVVLELLEGQTLEDRIAAGPLDDGSIVALARQAAAGLGALHAAGYVHRDVKPANLFLTTGGLLKLLDFGIVLPTVAHTRATEEGGVLGTPAYLAPEQARGLRDLDVRVDVWALGMVLAECVAGRPIFERDTPLATVVAVLFDEAPSLAAVRPSVDPALAAVVDRALRKEPSERWPSMASITERLTTARAATTLRPSALAATGLVPSAPTMADVVRPAEHRVLAVLLATGVRDLDRMRAAIVDAGGEFTSIAGARAIGLFGHRAWEGDETTRAVLAALTARSAAGAVAVASGRGTLHGTSLSGSVLASAERGCAAALEGVAIDDTTAAVLPRAFARIERATYVHEVVSHEPDSAMIALSDAAEPEAMLLGREAELAAIGDAVQRTVDDGARVALVVLGSPGIGKSRLLSAAHASAIDAGIDVLSARSDGQNAGRSLGLFAAILRGRARRRGPAGDPRALDALLRESGLEAASAPFLGLLLGLEVEGTDAVRAARDEPALMRERLRLAVLEWFDGLCRHGPVALVLDDLHRADAGSLALLRELALRAEERPVLFCVAARPELAQAAPELLAELRPTRLELAGLGGRNVARLGNALAGRALPEATLRAIVERTGGNPFFVEQIVHALADRADGPLESLPLPWTVEAAVQSRLDLLPGDEKDLCKRAAIVRRPFTAADLRALGVLAPEPLLDVLTRRDVFARRAASAEHRFRSPLFAEVAYRMLDDTLRADLHRRHAASLAERTPLDPEEIAQHLEAGGDTQAAALAYAVAAEAAASHADGATVIRCAERALSLGVAPTRALTLELARAEALGFLGEVDRQAQALAAAAILATTPGDRAEVRSKEGARLWRTGKRAEALAAFEDALVSARESDDLDVRVVALCRCATGLVYAGRSTEASALLEEAGAIEAERPVHLRALVAQARADLAAASGDFAARERAYARAAQLFGEAGDSRRAASAETNLADVLNRLGAYREAESALRAAIEMCRRASYRVMEGYASVNLGYALTMQGRVQEGLVAIEHARALGSATGERLLVLFARLYRVRAAGAGLDAMQTAIEADAIASNAHGAGLGTVEALALAAAARAHLALGDVASGGERSSRAIAIVDALGAIEEDEVDVLLAHVETHEAASRPGEARATLDRARDRVRAVANRIADPARREHFLRSVPAHRGLEARGVVLD